MNDHAVDAMRYAVKAMSEMGPKIYVYRGREVGFVRVKGAELVKPWCGVCQRSVDSADVGPVLALNSLRMVAYCHGRMQVVEVPLWRIGRAERFELGGGVLERAPAALRDMMVAVQSIGLELQQEGTDMVNNWKMFIRRVRGDYWAALAMTAILNTSPFAEVKHLLWGDREDRGHKELMLFIWVNAPSDVENLNVFFHAQLDIIDAALEQIPGFKQGGEFHNT